MTISPWRRSEPLPAILSREEVGRLLQTASRHQLRNGIRTIYAARPVDKRRDSADRHLGPHCQKVSSRTWFFRAGWYPTAGP